MWSLRVQEDRVAAVLISAYRARGTGRQTWHQAYAFIWVRDDGGSDCGTEHVERKGQNHSIC